MVLKQLGIHIWKNKVELPSYTTYKIQLTVGAKTVKLLGVSLMTLGLAIDSYMTPEAKSTKEKIN